MDLTTLQYWITNKYIICYASAYMYSMIKEFVQGAVCRSVGKSPNIFVPTRVYFGYIKRRQEEQAGTIKEQMLCACVQLVHDTYFITYSYIVRNRQKHTYLTFHHIP